MAHVSRIRKVGPRGRETAYILLPIDLRRENEWVDNIKDVRIIIEGKRIIVEPID